MAEEEGDSQRDVISSTTKEEEEEEALLRHTSLESVATQLLECQHILEIIKQHMVSLWATCNSERSWAK